MKTKHPSAYAPSREAHLDLMIEGARRILHRPNDPSDLYYTVEACEAWAEKKVDTMLAKGQLVIGTAPSA